ncbi:rod shape-determining protein MreD [Butyrivibrio sp. NC3005]|uniref:rod shape-determining protein MreD n=1 Tax=Butyrivibrio sp. NC3005 TaxID=1280685 RepID=UPI00040314B0|nr:rod shape-determining protein MreD [Butyrivibrio sp. NC3005]
MRKFLATFLMILVCYLLQTTVFSYFRFGDIVPNCLLIITVSSGIMRGDRHGLLAGFVCGLLVDIFFGNFIGFYAILYMYAGFLSGIFHKIYFPENMLFSLGVITGVDFCYGFLVYVLSFLLRSRFAFGYYLLHIIVPEVIYTSIVAVFLYPVILKVNMKVDDIIQGSAKKFV